MPDYSKPPTDHDVYMVLSNAGFTLNKGLDFTGAAQAGWDKWEERTDYRPFLATRQTRYFDPPSFGPKAGRTSASQGGRVLELDAGLLDLPDDGLLIGRVVNTQPMLGISQGITDSTGSQGTVLTRGIQYYLKPNDAFERGLPWTHIEFPSPTRGVDQSVVVKNGLWGRARTVPPDVWMTITRYCASLLLPELNIALTGGVASVKDEQGSVSFYAGGVSPVMAIADKWQEDFCVKARRMKRPTV